MLWRYYSHHHVSTSVRFCRHGECVNTQFWQHGSLCTDDTLRHTNITQRMWGTLHTVFDCSIGTLGTVGGGGWGRFVAWQRHVGGTTVTTDADVTKRWRAELKLESYLYIYRCVRQPGLASEFISVSGKGDAYRCLQCKRYEKNRSLTIINDAIVPETQHPLL